MLCYSEEAVIAMFAVFGLSRPVIEPTIYHTRGEHANKYVGQR